MGDGPGISGTFSVGFLSELGTVFWDNLLSLFPLMALLIIITSIDSIMSGRRYAFFCVALAGIIAGIGAGLKLVFILYVFSLLISLFFISIPWKRKLMFMVLFGVASAIGLMGMHGAWFWTIWHQFGNPIFPMMNNVFHGELAAISPIHDIRFLPRNYYEEIFFPAVFTIDPYHVGELRYREISWLVVYLASVYFFFYKASHSIYKERTPPLRPEIKYLLSFFWISFILWMNLFSIYRYLITVEILIPLVLFVLFASLYEIKPLTRVLVVAMLAFITIININGTPCWGRAPWGDKVFRFDTPRAQKGKVDSVVLIDQPLGWIIPALDIKVPFIQIMNNFPVSQVYVQRAKSLLKNSRHGKILVIFNPWVTSFHEALDRLKKIRFLL